MVLLHLGRLLAPAHEIANRATPPSITEYRVLAAQFEPDLCLWENDVSRFAILGDFRFSVEYDEIAQTARQFYGFLRDIVRERIDPNTTQIEIRDRLNNLQCDLVRLLDKIPIQWEPQLSAAKTPFKTCFLIRDAINTAQNILDYFDRYLDLDFFPLYLRQVNRSVSVRLITTRGNAQYGVTAVLPMARLAAQEFSSFQLVESTPADLHDRNLRVDNQNFHLGTSTNSAGKHPTNFNPADSTANGHLILDQIIAKGTVVI